MLAVTAMTGSVKPPQLGQVVGKLGKVAEDEANVRIMMLRGKNSSRGGSFNIGRDVTVMPHWAKDVYQRNWGQIEACSARG